METNYIEAAIRMLRDELNEASRQYVERSEQRGDNYVQMREHEVAKMNELSTLIEKLKGAAK